MSGWGPDTEGHVGWIMPYCLQVDVFSKTDPTHPPPPPHAWMAGVIRDILIRFVPNVWEIILIGLGSAILFFGRHAYLREGLFPLEAEELAASVNQEVEWVGQIVEVQATPLPM